MLVWVIYAQTNVTSRLQVVLSATFLCTSRQCFWWLHLRDLPKWVCFFPKVLSRVSALGLFTSKCFCDSPKQQHKTPCFKFPFFPFSYREHCIFYLELPPPFPLLSKMVGKAVSKQSLVPINLWFPLRNPQTSRVPDDLKQTAHAHSDTHALVSWRTIWKYSSFLPSRS